MECSICLDELYHSIVRLECSHAFHKLCIDMWLNNNNTCPLCRERSKNSDIVAIPSPPRQTYQIIEPNTTRITIQCKIIAICIGFFIVITITVLTYILIR